MIVKFPDLRRYLALKHIDSLLSLVIPWLGIMALMIIALGLVWGLFFAPSDYLQQDAFRIIYVHVPSAFLSLLIYTVMAGSSFMALVFHLKVFDYWARGSASVGAAFTFLALLTGAIWGKPMWGTWWVWDARLTSELILLFIYLGVILLRGALERAHQPQTAAQVLTLVGLINIPIVHFSVNWWFTLHQGATLSRFAKPAMHTDMLWPLLICILGFGLFYLYLSAIHTRTIIWKKHQHEHWLQERV
jgi:heme exporter protein C